MAKYPSAIRVKIKLDDDIAEDVAAKALEAEGGDVQEQQLESFTSFVVAAIAVIGLAKAIKSLWDDFQQGVIVDTRGPEVVVRKDRNLPKGTVVVISKSGVETKVEQPDHESLKDLIDAALIDHGGFK